MTGKTLQAIKRLPEPDQCDYEDGNTGNLRVFRQGRSTNVVIEKKNPLMQDDAQKKVGFILYAGLTWGNCYITTPFK